MSLIRFRSGLLAHLFDGFTTKYVETGVEVARHRRVAGRSGLHVPDAARHAGSPHRRGGGVDPARPSELLCARRPRFSRCHGRQGRPAVDRRGRCRLARGGACRARVGPDRQARRRSSRASPPTVQQKTQGRKNDATVPGRRHHAGGHHRARSRCRDEAPLGRVQDRTVGHLGLQPGYGEGLHLSRQAGDPFLPDRLRLERRHPARADPAGQRLLDL